MLFEIIGMALSLNLAGLFGLITENLVWVFGLSALAYIFFDGKKPVKAFVVLVLYVFTAGMFESISGWVLFAGGFLMLYYVSQIALLKFVEETGFFKNKLQIADAIYFYALLAVYNLFLAPWWLS